MRGNGGLGDWEIGGLGDIGLFKKSANFDKQ